MHGQSYGDTTQPCDLDYDTSTALNLFAATLGPYVTLRRLCRVVTWSRLNDTGQGGGTSGSIMMISG
jgi:hypothetical protein